MRETSFAHTLTESIKQHLWVESRSLYIWSYLLLQHQQLLLYIRIVRFVNFNTSGGGITSNIRTRTHMRVLAHIKRQILPINILM